MKLFWTERAEQDLQANKRYITTDNPSAAKWWVQRLIERAGSPQCSQCIACRPSTTGIVTRGYP